MAVDDREMCEYEKVIPITCNAALIVISQFDIASCNLSSLATLPIKDQKI